MPRANNWERQQQNEDPAAFEVALEAMLLAKPDDHLLDSYALRNLVHACPVAFEELSSLPIGPDKFVSRCAVHGPTGEEVVLTFELKQTTPMPPTLNPQQQQQPSLPPHLSKSAPVASHTSSDQVAQAAQDAVHLSSLSPAGSNSSAAAQGSAAGGSVHKQPQAPPPWRLARVRGEPAFPDLPHAPSPEFPPEVVVQAQLAALQDYDFATVYALLSPAARMMMGSLDQFINTLGRNRAYRPLVHHRAAHSVRRCQSSRDTYLEIVAVQGERARTADSLYCWVLKRVSAEGPFNDCWVTEWVKVVDDPKVLQALGIVGHAPGGGDNHDGHQGSRGNSRG